MVCDRDLLEKLHSARELPTIPTVLVPLLQYLEKPLDSQDINEIVRMIAQDESLAARCLQLANSPLFGNHSVESIQSAVVALGLERIHEIAVSCSLIRVQPSTWSGIAPSVFWAHSLACALMAKEFASKIGFTDGSKAYAAALLHDIGIVALLWLAPQQFGSAAQVAKTKHISLHEAELLNPGISHIEAGKIIGERWKLPPDLVEVIACHHSPEKATRNRALSSIVSLSDLLCRMNGLGHGQREDRQTTITHEAAFEILVKEFSSLRGFDWARFTFEMEGMAGDVEEAVKRVYGTVQ